MRIIAIFILVCLVFVFSGRSQNIGKITINQDDKITQLLQDHKTFNKNQTGIVGYRIHIFFDSGNNSKSKAYSIKSQFMAEYPDVEAYIVYQEPNYKVKVGDFRTRIDAQRFQNEISNEYKNAFIIKEIINLPKIK
jgi:hypothetical protein